MKLLAAGRRFPGLRIQCTQRRKFCPQSGCPDLKHPHRRRHIPQPSRSQIEQIDTGEQCRGRVGQQDLTAVPGAHHPRSTVEHRAEVVPIPQLCLPGRNAHPHRQLQRSLRCHRSIDRTLGRGEGCAYPVTGVAEQKPSCPSIAVRSTSSWAASAARMPSASFSHRRVEPSISVNRKVTTPEGAGAGSADTHAESHSGTCLPRTSADSACHADAPPKPRCAQPAESVHPEAPSWDDP